MEYDVAILGAGIGGMETALSLGDMGFQVLLIEKEASVGGKMILLSKVFPTLDCASCISTPKMAAAAAHPNVHLMVYTEVDRVASGPDGTFALDVRRKPTYVDFAKCTGCSLCEAACTVAVPDEFNADLASRRAAHIAFPQAVPKKAIITRRGRSPCSHTCPAGVRPHGYISLVRAGKLDEAFRQHLEDAPLPGCLSRACYAPCEGECSRTDLDGTVAIRGIKRFMVDRYYAAHPEPEYGPVTRQSGKRVAIVGSGPAGLTAAFYLARDGHAVTIFEADDEPGGIMRWGIPSYRLPKDVLARDVRNITALGVDIQLRHPVESIASLARFDAVFLATGSTGGTKLQAPGEEADGVLDAVEFLHGINAGTPTDLTGRRVAVIGGGDVAMDAARSAVRLGAAEVTIVYRRTKAEMPAHPEELAEAEAEGVKVLPSRVAERVVSEGPRVVGLELVGAKSGGDRRSKLVLDPSVRERLAIDTVIRAIGLTPNTPRFAGELTLNRNGTVAADPESLRTSQPNVFAGGDAVLGPATITDAIGQGKRAAASIDRFLRGLELPPAAAPMPMADRAAVVARARAEATPRPAGRASALPIEVRRTSFADCEITMDEAAARASANRCLDCGVCSDCRECIAACPSDAIDLAMPETRETVRVRAVALATGFDVFDARRKPLLGFGRFPNVITGVQMDRLLAPTRPFNAVVRPSDGKAPSNVAFVLCTGSRDEQVNNRACSRVCCMYTLKHTQLLMGALPLADVTVYYTDVRAYGKGYEEFYQQTREMGVRFVRGKIARIEETEGQDLLVHFEDMEGEGGARTATHDLVVLAVGLLPTQLPKGFELPGPLDRDSFEYVKEPDEELEPGRTSLAGIFAVGSATAARDIPDTVLHAGAAAAQIASYLKRKVSR